MRQTIICLLLAAFILSSCAPQATPSAYPTYDPFVAGGDGLPIQPVDTGPLPTRTPGPTPTRAPLSVTLPTPRGLDAPVVTPTPDIPRTLPTQRQDADQYVVQAGDTLGIISQKYGVSLEALMQANGLSDPDLLTVGTTLDVPVPDPGAVGPSFKVIPDSELVYGPASTLFNVDEFVQSKGGYLAGYTQDVNGEVLTATQIITRVAENYSVNPRLLLALIEHQSHWVTQTEVFVSETPLGFVDTFHAGLYRQLTWAANELNRGFYLWRANAVSSWVLADGSIVPVNATINAGTAGVQRLFAQLDALEGWQADVNVTGLFQTYYLLFLQNPFDLAIEPLKPFALKQPRFTLPFAQGETWSFTGGPHGGWDTGSGWAAIDFAPPGEMAGCTPSDSWVTAIADGLIVRSFDGAVVQDLDGDGYEQTGWDILYMHIDSNQRVTVGTYVFAGDPIGHPSCEGGVSNGTHVHLARRYNGEWIPADGPLPFNLDGWISSGTGNEYDGYLTRGSSQVEAWDGVNELNQITR